MIFVRGASKPGRSASQALPLGRVGANSSAGVGDDGGTTASGILRLVGVVVVAASVGVGAYMGRSAAGWLFSSNPNSPMAARVETHIADMKSEARRMYPDLPQSEAMSRYAREVAAPAHLAKFTNGDERKRQAAGIFMGFWQINMRARVDFCRERGFDISDFTDAFSRINSKPYGRAVMILEAAGLDEDKLFKPMERQLKTAVTQDMRDIASKTFTSLDGACRLIAKKSNAISDYLQFKSLQPQVYATLME